MSAVSSAPSTMPISTDLLPSLDSKDLVWTPGCSMKSTQTTNKSKSIVPALVACAATGIAILFMDIVAAVVAIALTVFLLSRSDSSTTAISTPCKVKLSPDEISAQKIALPEEEYELLRALFEKSGATTSPLCPITKNFMLVPARTDGAYHEYSALTDPALGLQQKDIKLLQPGDTTLTDAVNTTFCYLMRLGSQRMTREMVVAAARDGAQVAPITNFGEMTRKVTEDRLTTEDAFSLTNFLVEKLKSQHEQLGNVRKELVQKQDADFRLVDHNSSGAKGAEDALDRFKLFPSLQRPLLSRALRTPVDRVQFIQHNLFPGFGHDLTLEQGAISGRYFQAVIQNRSVALGRTGAHAEEAPDAIAVRINQEIDENIAQARAAQS